MKSKDSPSPAYLKLPHFLCFTTGLMQDEFTQRQKAIVRLRCNVIKSTKDQE